MVGRKLTSKEKLRNFLIKKAKEEYVKKYFNPTRPRKTQGRTTAAASSSSKRAAARPTKRRKTTKAKAPRGRGSGRGRATCQARTRDGTSCKRRVYDPSDPYCWQHGGKGERFYDARQYEKRPRKRRKSGGRRRRSSKGVGVDARFQNYDEDWYDAPEQYVDYDNDAF